MGGECYRYCKLKSLVLVTNKQESIYQTLLPVIIEKVKNFLQNQPSNDWIAVFDGNNALELQVKNQKLFERKIVLPYNLNHALDIGWQHFSYGETIDPKCEIADEQMK